MSCLDDFPIGLYEKALPAVLSWPERFEKAQQAGYDFVELSVDDSDERRARLDWSAAQRREFRSQIETSGLYVPTMALSGHHRFPIGSADDNIRAIAMNMMEKAINLASETGIRIVQLAGYDEVEGCVGTAQTAANYTASLELGIRMAAKMGVVLAIENMGVPFMDSISKVMKIVNHFNSPWLQAYGDIGNSTAMGQDVVADIESARGHLAAMHIKDTIPGIVRDIPFGEGTVDFQKCFRAVKNIAYSGMLVIEMWAHDRQDAFDEAKRARIFIERHMETVWSE